MKTIEVDHSLASIGEDWARSGRRLSPKWSWQCSCSRSGIAISEPMARRAFTNHRNGSLVEKWHGTLNGYTTRKCRCGECSRVAAEYRAAYYAANTEQAAVRKSEYYAKNREWLVANARDAKYNLVFGQFDEMVEAQHNQCAICDVTFSDENKPHVDHDHACCPGWKSCGKCVRGLLCKACNRALGILEDDSERLRRAADYLERAK